MTRRRPPAAQNWKEVRAERSEPAEPVAAAPAAPAVVDWGTEEVFYEGPPSRGDLLVNVLLGFTLLWLVRPGRTLPGLSTCG